MGESDLEEEIDEDEDEVTDDVDGDDEETEASLEHLYEAEVVKDQAADGLEDEDDHLVKAMEATDKAPNESLTVKVRRRTVGEFQCQACFLIKKPSQLADAKMQFCVDCV